MNCSLSALRWNSWAKVSWAQWFLLMCTTWRESGGRGLICVSTSVLSYESVFVQVVVIELLISLVLINFFPNACTLWTRFRIFITAVGDRYNNTLMNCSLSALRWNSWAKVSLRSCESPIVRLTTFWSKVGSATDCSTSTHCNVNVHTYWECVTPNTPSWATNHEPIPLAWDKLIRVMGPIDHLPSSVSNTHSSPTLTTLVICGSALPWWCF